MHKKTSWFGCYKDTLNWKINSIDKFLENTFVAVISNGNIILNIVLFARDV